MSQTGKRIFVRPLACRGALSCVFVCTRTCTPASLCVLVHTCVYMCTRTCTYLRPSTGHAEACSLLYLCVHTNAHSHGACVRGRERETVCVCVCVCVCVLCVCTYVGPEANPALQVVCICARARACVPPRHFLCTISFCAVFTLPSSDPSPLLRGPAPTPTSQRG